MLIGVHPNDAGGIDMAVRRAAAAGATALQVFSAKPQFYNEKISVRPERAQRFRQAMAECGLSRDGCLVHAAYVLNTASPEPEKAERAALGLAKELERTEALGAFACCFHPGSAQDGDAASAIDRVGDAVARAAASVPGSARVLIENTAGAGRTMGRTPEEIAGMLRRVPAELRARAGYGLDTCHLFASGLDFTSSREAARALIDRFCDVIGEAPAFLHCNDSEGAFGSNRDRHALIGAGQVGTEPFAWLLQDARLRGVPCILETPHARETVADDDASPDPYDVDMVIRLRELAG
ncbi:MAG: deoxyribonuclease IV [Gemmatimonadetes bacterium]|nr:deoxyribonuclease IV [Gemmatimonadota bacterium]